MNLFVKKIVYPNPQYRYKVGVSSLEQLDLKLKTKLAMVGPVRH